MSESVRYTRSDVGAVLIDERHYPVIMVAWIGTPSEHTILEYFKWSEEFHARLRLAPQVFAIISDATQGGRPNAMLRALIAEKTKDADAVNADLASFMCPSAIILDSPLIRGAITAIGWLTGSRGFEYFGSTREALLRIKRAFEDRGALFPASIDIERYEWPKVSDPPDRRIG